MKESFENINKSSKIKQIIADFVNSKLDNYETDISDVLKDLSLKEVSDLVFNEAINLTGSKYCYVAYLDPENNDSVGISFSHLTDGCKMFAEMGEARFKVRKDGSYGGLLGYSLDTGESFYVHDITSHPVAHGLPKGHAPVDQFLSVAVKYEGRILGQIVLANPKGDYNNNHLEIADRLADFYGIALKEMVYSEK
ncbi:MAG: GAF domain-containing protein [Methanobacterium sp.]|uniref:GAF domain-containing protein n=1 Tax=Methanobacterium sp. TaxID=2164 RepID=UPI003D64F6AD|nr:GAF domain-containing protein [Methanobacterium sp.]